MIRINLLPVRASKKKETAKQQVIIFCVTLVAFLIVIFVVHSMQVMKLRKVKAEITSAEKEIARLKTVVGEIESIKKLQEEVKKKLDILNRLRTEKTGPAIRLGKLSDAVPDKLWLTRYTEAANGVAISGIAYNEDIIADFLRKLVATNEFLNVELLVSEQLELSGIKVKKFDISCSLASAKKEPAAKPK